MPVSRACLRRALLTARLSQACARLSSATDAAPLVAEKSSRSRPTPDASTLAFLNVVADRKPVFARASPTQVQQVLDRASPDAAIVAATTAVAKAEAALTSLIARSEAGRKRSLAESRLRSAVEETGEGGDKETIQGTRSQEDVMMTDGTDSGEGYRRVADSVKGDENATRDGKATWHKEHKAGMIHGRQSIEDSLRVFEQEVQPLLRKARPGDHIHLFALARRFINSVRKQVVDTGMTGFSVRLSKLGNSIGDWRLDTRNELVLSLCHTIIKQNEQQIDLRTAQRNDQEKHSLVKELVDMWKHISQCRRPSQTRESQLRFTLPSPESIITTGGQDGSSNSDENAIRAFNVALASIFNQHSVDEACSLVPGLLVTLSILSDKKLASSSFEGETAALLNMVAAALPHDAKRKDYLQLIMEQPRRLSEARRKQLYEYTLAQWPEAVKMLCVPYSTWRMVLAKQANSRRETSDLAVFHRQAQAAFKVNSKGGVASVWKSFQDRLREQPELIDQLAGLPDFVDFWLFVWCAMRLPQMVEPTLSLMRQAKMEPTVRSYTAMMHGWKLCKDHKRINELWAQILKSGIRLDAAIWTERISALVEARKPQEALMVLGELQARWKREAENKLDSDSGSNDTMYASVKPTIEMVNAAFMGVLRIDKRAAHQVLAWAEKEGIEANVRTYNALLREAFQNPNSDEAVRTIFSTMQQCGIEPDGATFTVCLEEILGTMHNNTEAEQVEAVQQILADVTQAGLRPNGEMYAKMVHVVASLPGGGADEAIAVVEKHMHTAGMPTTPHIVTILIERAVSRNPPGDVEGLLRRYGLKHVLQGDQTLWERVMSARANLGRCDDALALFDQLNDSARPVTSLSCLDDLLIALLRASRLDDARRIVKVVVTCKIRHVRENNDLGPGRYWHHHFWHRARKHDLLPWRVLTTDLRQYFSGLNEL